MRNTEACPSRPHHSLAEARVREAAGKWRERWVGRAKTNVCNNTHALRTAET